MTLEEWEQAHTLLTRALTEPTWRTASQALDDLLRNLLVVHRLLEAEEGLTDRESPTEPTSSPRCSSVNVGDRSKSAGGVPLGGGSRPHSLAGGPAESV